MAHVLFPKVATSKFATNKANKGRIELKRVHELEAWSTPGQLLHPDYGKAVLQQELWKEGIPKDVYLGASNTPDPAHCIDLRMSIQSGELTEESFRAFCVAHSLSVSLQSAESACKFLEYTRGTCLAWIHLPEDGDVDWLPKIKKWLEDRGHIVVDPQKMTRTV